MGIVPAGRLVWGVQLPVVAQSKMVASPWERGLGAGPLVESAKAADGAGAFYVAVCDHTAIPRAAAETMSTTWYHPFVTLSYLAAVTETTRLMTNVLVGPFRHPLETAKAVSTLDELSAGRALVGVGAGHVEGEFEALGVDFAERGSTLDESIDLLRVALADEYPAFDGPTLHVHGVGLAPRPVQDHVPIWVGGSSRPALRRAAERGDGWIPQGTPRDKMPEQIEYLERHRDDVRPGAEIEIGAMVGCHVGEAEWDVPRGALVASPDEIVESYNEYGSWGVSHLQVKLHARSLDEYCDQLAAFGSQVAPHLIRV